MDRETLKKLLLSFNESDYNLNLVDLHIHSKESDGSMTPIQIVEQARNQGKKYIAIADHNTIEAYVSTNILSNSIVIPAVEFDCLHKGIPIHILGYGFNIDDKFLKDLFSPTMLGRKNNLYRLFKQRLPEEVIYKIRNAGGVSILAHPACYWCYNLENFVKSLIYIGLDGVETYYPYKRFRRILKFHSTKTVFDIAEKYNLIKTGGSDTHGEKLGSVVR